MFLANQVLLSCLLPFLEVIARRSQHPPSLAAFRVDASRALRTSLLLQLSDLGTQRLLSTIAALFGALMALFGAFTALFEALIALFGAALLRATRAAHISTITAFNRDHFQGSGYFEP